MKLTIVKRIEGKAMTQDFSIMKFDYDNKKYNDLQVYQNMLT